jgi:lysophospholipase L1-like esterase
MAEKHPKDFPETGWGVPFSWFFNDTIVVENHAKNGRSTRTFISEGRWQKIISAIRPHDIVFIQFGHNDASEHKKDRYTTAKDYRKNLKQMLGQVLEKQGEPILMTPLVRRHFDDDGRLKKTHPYTSLVRELANEHKLTLIDLEKITHEYFENMGESLSALRFMHIAPGLNPNYPVGVRDNTHLNPLGALEVAQLVLADLKKQNHPLASRLRDVDPKHRALSY